MNVLPTHIFKLLSTLLVVTFLGTLVFGLLPFVVNVYEKQKALTSQNDQIEFMGNWKEQLVELDSTQTILDGRIKTVYTELVSEGEFSTIIERLFEEAQSTSSSIKRIQPTGSVSNGEYVEKKITLDVNGSYHSIARFINKIEQSGIMIEVESFSIKESDSNPSILDGVVTIQVTVLRS